MPQNKRESFIYTVIMCFTMVLWMSIYNVTLHTGTFNAQVIKDAWLGFPIAYVFAACMDWFVVSGLAKGFAFKYLVKPDSSTLRKCNFSFMFNGCSNGNYNVTLWCS